jgi:hypothetical protein
MTFERRWLLADLLTTARLRATGYSLLAACYLLLATDCTGLPSGGTAFWFPSR